MFLPFVTVTADTTPQQLFTAVQAIPGRQVYIKGGVYRDAVTRRPKQHAKILLVVYKAADLLAHAGRSVHLRLTGDDKVTDVMHQAMMDAIVKKKFTTRSGIDASTLVPEVGSDQVEIEVKIYGNGKCYVIAMMQGLTSNFSPCAPVDCEERFKNTPYAVLFIGKGYQTTWPEQNIQGLKCAHALFNVEKGKMDEGRMLKNVEALGILATAEKDESIRLTLVDGIPVRTQLARHLFHLNFTCSKPSISKACGGFAPLPASIFPILNGDCVVDHAKPLSGFEATQAHSANRLTQAVCYLMHMTDNADIRDINLHLWKTGGREYEQAQHGKRGDMDAGWGSAVCGRYFLNTDDVIAAGKIFGAFGFGAFIAVALAFGGRFENPAFQDYQVLQRQFGLEEAIYNADLTINEDRLRIATDCLLNAAIAAMQAAAF